MAGGGGGGGGSAGGGAWGGGMRQQTARLLGLQLAARATSPLERAECVREFFPKLAYCVSDVVVLVGTEPLFST